jgi:hypothetical protein
MEHKYLGELLMSKSLSDPMSKLGKKYAPILATLSQLNPQSYSLYKEHVIQTYLREGKIEAILYLLEDSKEVSQTKRSAIRKKIKEILSTLSSDEIKELSNKISLLIPKTILKSFVSPNKLDTKLVDDIQMIIDNQLPIHKDRWSQLFTVIGTFEDNQPLLKYLNHERKRLIKNKEWNESLDKRLIMPLLSGNPSTLNRWVAIVYTILGDDMFDMIPNEEFKIKIKNLLYNN